MRKNIRIGSIFKKVLKQNVDKEKESSSNENIVQNIGRKHTTEKYFIANIEGTTGYGGGDTYLKYYSLISGKLLQQVVIPETLFKFNEDWQCRNCSIRNSGIVFGDYVGNVFRLMKNDEIVKLEHKKFQAKHGNLVICMDAYEDKLLLTGGKDNPVSLWNLQNNKFVHEFTNIHKKWVYCTMFLKDSLCGSSCYDGTVKIFDYVKRKELKTMTHGTYVYDLAYEKEKNVLFSCANNQKIIKFDLRRFKEVKTIKTKDSVNSLLYFNNFLFAGDCVGNLRCFDVRKFKDVLCNRKVHSEYIWKLDRSTNNEVITGSWDGHIKVFESKSGSFKELVSIKSKRKVCGQVFLKNERNEMDQRDLEDRILYLFEETTEWMDFQIKIRSGTTIMYKLMLLL